MVELGLRLRWMGWANWRAGVCPAGRSSEIMSTIPRYAEREFGSILVVAGTVRRGAQRRQPIQRALEACIRIERVVLVAEITAGRRHGVLKRGIRPKRWQCTAGMQAPSTLEVGCRRRAGGRGRFCSPSDSSSVRSVLVPPVTQGMRSSRSVSRAERYRPPRAIPTAVDAPSCSAHA